VVNGRAILAGVQLYIAINDTKNALSNSSEDIKLTAGVFIFGNNKRTKKRRMKETVLNATQGIYAVLIYD